MKYLLSVFLVFSFLIVKGQAIDPSSIQGTPYKSGYLKGVTVTIDEFTGDTVYQYVHVDSIAAFVQVNDSIYLRNDTIFLRDGSGFVKLLDTSSVNELPFFNEIYDETDLPYTPCKTGDFAKDGNGNWWVCEADDPLWIPISRRQLIEFSLYSLLGDSVYTYQAAVDGNAGAFAIKVDSTLTISNVIGGTPTAFLKVDTSKIATKNDLTLIVPESTTVGDTPTLDLTLTGVNITGRVDTTLIATKFDLTTVSVVDSTTVTSGTGISVSESPANTFTVTNTSPDQTVSITGVGITNITGTYPNFTVTSNEVDGSVTNEIQDLSLSGNTLSLTGDATTVNLSSFAGNGTVTSAGLTLGSSGTDANLSGSPITSSGTITLNLPSSSTSNRGLLTASDWSSFDASNKTDGYVSINSTRPGRRVKGFFTNIDTPTNFLSGIWVGAGYTDDYGSQLGVDIDNGLFYRFLNNDTWTSWKRAIGASSFTVNTIPRYNGIGDLYNSGLTDDGTFIESSRWIKINHSTPVFQYLKSGSPIFIMGDEAGIWGTNPSSTSMFVYGNNSFNISTNSTKRLNIDGSGVVTLSNLSGTGNRLTQASSTGVLSAVTVGTGLSLSSGTLSSAVTGLSGGSTGYVPYWTSSTSQSSTSMTWSTWLPALELASGSALRFQGSASIIDKYNSYGPSGYVISKDAGGGIAWISPSGLSPTNLSYSTKSGTDIYLESSSGADVILRDGSGITLNRIASNVVGFDASDASITNEGYLGVAAGGSNDALLRGYNSAGTTTGNGTTISGGSGISVTESTSTNGGTVTLTNVGSHYAELLTNPTTFTQTWDNTPRSIDFAFTETNGLTVNASTDKITIPSGYNGDYKIEFSGSYVLNGVATNEMIMQVYKNGSVLDNSRGYVVQQASGGNFMNFSKSTTIDLVASDEIQVVYYKLSGSAGLVTFYPSSLIVQRIK